MHHSAVMLRLGAMGDVALTTGVLRHWHQTHGTLFTVVTRAAFAPIFAHHTAVKQVIALHPDELAMPRLLSVWRQLSRAHAGETLVDLHGTPRSLLLSMLWRGTVRRYPKLALQRRSFLLSGGRVGQEALNRYTVPQRYALALDATAPPAETLAPHIFLTKEEQAAAQTWLTTRLPQGTIGQYVALHPYATHANKAWAAAYWQALIAKLDHLGISWFVVGYTQKTASRLPIPAAADFTNQTDLRQTCALLACARALVTGDSGPMHLASGVGTPVVALFGPTTREWGFFPQGATDRVLEATSLPCRPCSLHGSRPCPHNLACMADITPEDVLTALSDGASKPSVAYEREGTFF